MRVSRDDFDLWLANPVTEAVLRTVARNAEDNKDHWIELSWRGGSADPVVLADLRARADTAQCLSQLEYEDLLEELRDDEESKRNTAD